MFITFEGIDGSGKTTSIEKLKEHIQKKYEIDNFVFTREPGGFGIKECEEIRRILLDKENFIDSMSEMLLYLVSRKMHVDKLIKPSINLNKIVLCDRFYDSSFAYQGFGRGLGLELVEKYNLETLDNFKPDYTFYFKVDFETTIKRLISNNRNLDRLENEDKNFFKKSIEGYDFISKRDSKRYIIIDATKSIDEVKNQVIENFDKIMNEYNKKQNNV